MLFEPIIQARIGVVGYAVIKLGLHTDMVGRAIDQRRHAAAVE